MAHSSFAPPDPARNGVLAFVNFVLVDDIVLMGVREGLSLIWSVMVCQWAMRMALGTFAVNETKGQEEAPWEQKKILWGVGHDASAVHVDPMALGLQMTPVKREKGRDLFFNKLFQLGVIRVREVASAGARREHGFLWLRLPCNVATDDEAGSGDVCVA